MQSNTLAYCTKAPNAANVLGSDKHFYHHQIFWESLIESKALAYCTKVFKVQITITIEYFNDDGRF
jgi:hypothetical protein